MSQVMYIDEVECSVTPADHDHVIAVVQGERGEVRRVRIRRDAVSEAAGKTYLPMQVMAYDYAEQRAYVDLPGAAAGDTRLWVPLRRLREQPGEVPGQGPG